MASEQQDQGRDRGAPKKSVGNSRRVWTNREEKVLINALKDLVAKGQKSDNGFKAGYLTKLEEALKKEFPMTDLVATPNITSKLTTWKKTYGSIVTAHLTTGVGFNCVTSQLDVTNEQWMEVLKRDPTMRGMRYKEWPLYPDWVEIFGKDRATGEKAEDIIEMAKKTKLPYKIPEMNADTECNGENFVDLDAETNANNTQQTVNEEQEENSAAYTTRSAPPMRMSGKKRKSKSDNESTMTKMLGEFCHSTGERLERIAGRIGYDHDLGRARKQLFEELGKIPGLTIRDRLNVAKKIGGKVEELEIWSGLPDEARAVYVMDTLMQDGN